MSIKYVEAVMGGPQSLTGSKLLVMLALAEWADDNGLSWHCVAEIAKRARLKERATQYVLQQLADAGYLYIEEGRGRNHTSRYTILLDLLAPEIKGAKGATIPAPFNKEEKVQKVQNIEEKVQNHDIKGATAIAPEPSLTVIEPSVKREIRAAPKPQPLETSFPDDFEVSDADYNEMRRRFPDLDIKDATEEWADSMRSNRKKYKYSDWRSAWKGAMRRAAKWQAERPARSSNGNGKDKPTRMERSFAAARAELDFAGLDEIQDFGVQGSYGNHQGGYSSKRLQPPKSA